MQRIWLELKGILYVLCTSVRSMIVLGLIFYQFSVYLQYTVLGFSDEPIFCGSTLSKIVNK